MTETMIQIKHEMPLESGIYKDMYKEAQQANADLHAHAGPGNDYLGWIDLPQKTDASLIRDIEDAAGRMRKFQVVLCIGIGGSYLGGRAVIDALGGNDSPEILYAGHHLGSTYYKDLLDYLADKDFGVVVISKSGTTTEPAIAFRLVRELMAQKFSKKEIARRVIAITDASKGALRKLASEWGFQCFTIPDDVGGRYSVFTPVGLLPVAIAGISIHELLRGAQNMQKKTLPDSDLHDNPAIRYAVLKNYYYRKDKGLEILSVAQPELHCLAEWWKQLFGESEGKDGKGVFPASLDLTTDLHSLGQYLQEGRRMLFESFLIFDKAINEPLIPEDPENADGLNYLAGKELSYVNQKAVEGTMQAHKNGGVPVIAIHAPELNAFYLGQILYMFQKACGISGYMLGVNPFNQPGVEAYKKNMFRLLGKPGGLAD